MLNIDGKADNLQLNIGSVSLNSILTPLYSIEAVNNQLPF